MVTISLDQITRNVLLRKGYSLHFYMSCILYAKDCLRQLVEDDLQVLNTKILPIDLTSNTAELPSDFLDNVLVAIRSGQNIIPLVESTSSDNLLNYNSDFELTKFSSANVTDLPANVNMLYGPYGFGQWFTTHYNNFGENVGRFFGGIAYYDTYKILRHLNKIKLNEALTFCDIVMVYISNGMDSSTATRITPYAQDTIESYIYYQLKLNNRTSNLGEIQMAEQDYISQRKILRARMSDLSLQQLKRIVHRNNIASPKS